MGQLLKDKVGRGGRNHQADVEKVIQLLNKHIEAGALETRTPLDENLPGSSQQLILKIEEFQKKVVKLRNPDGRVDPGGKTINALRITPKTPWDELAAIHMAMTQMALGPVGAIPEDLWEAALMSLLKHVNHKQLVRYNVLTLVDFRIPINQPRLWVVDLEARSELIRTHVSHGSGRGDTKHTPQFSNSHETHRSSLGGFVTLNQRTSTAGKLKSGKGPALIIEGLDSTNDQMKPRAIIFHAASYMNPDKGVYGRSWGCFATDVDDNARIIDRIRDGSFGYAYNGDAHKP